MFCGKLLWEICVLIPEEGSDARAAQGFLEACGFGDGDGREHADLRFG
jgi:hypothetical protein